MSIERISTPASCLVPSFRRSAPRAAMCRAPRRHTATESVYAKSRIGHGAVAGLFGFQESLTFEELNRDEMDEHLVSLQVPQSKRDEILRDWDSDREAAARERLLPYLYLRQIGEAGGKLREAQNEVLLNELYLTNQARRALTNLFTMLNNWLGVAKYRSDGLTRKYERGQLDEAIDTVRDILRTELTESTANPTRAESSSGTTSVKSRDSLADG